GVWQFAYMIAKYTGRNPLDYWGYGCWCGLGGKGNPVDAVDRCCYVHDVCYNSITQGPRPTCSRIAPYHKNYYFTGKKCSTGWLTSKCGRAICACDIAAVKCFRRNHFNKKYRLYKKNIC
uniref:Phospholipase A2 A2-actitoxin-Cgg2a n=1 Tax=Condylactis gigantea TaxID=47073 RepID=PA2_CONGI